MPPGFVIHAGFHKTGTTTLQSLLRQNKAALAPYAHILLREDMLRVCTAARGYSETRSALDLGLVQFELAETLQRLPDGPKDVILSSEDLAGHMPGRKNLTTYDAAPALMSAIADTIHTLHPDAHVTFLFTTRAPAGWLRSCYAQHVQTARMVMDSADYIKEFAPSAKLERIVYAISDAVPACHVESIALETTAPDRLGALDSLLSLTRIPPSQQALITPIPFENTSPSPEQLARILTQNRTNLDKEALNLRKKAVTSKGK